jgi:hypothetical protein
MHASHWAGVQALGLRGTGSSSESLDAEPRNDRLLGVRIELEKPHLRLRLHTPAPSFKPTDKNVQHFSTARVESQIADELTRRGIKFSGQSEPGLLQNLVSWLLPMVGFVLLCSCYDL